MEKFAGFIEGLDLDYLGRGKHKLNFNKVMELKEKNEVFILDVRSREEYECMKFGFAKHIPLNELPGRAGEIPKDKTIAIFCTSTTRASMAYTFLQVSGFEKAKVFAESIGDIASNFKPGYVLANYESLKNAD